MHSTFPNIRAEIQILTKLSLDRQDLCLGSWNVAIECLLSRSDRTGCIWWSSASPYEFLLPATTDHGEA